MKYLLYKLMLNVNLLSALRRFVNGFCESGFFTRRRIFMYQLPGRGLVYVAYGFTENGFRIDAGRDSGFALLYGRLKRRFAHYILQSLALVYLYAFDRRFDVWQSFHSFRMELYIRNAAPEPRGM